MGKTTVKSTVKFDIGKIEKLDKAMKTALEKTIEALHDEVVQAQVMPFDTGNMQNNSTFPDYSLSSNGKVSLVTATPYARRMYYHPEYNFQKKENPNARGEWYEDWLTGKNKDFVKNAFSAFFKKEAGL